MKLGILFSGGKDSTYAAYLAKKAGHEISCLITILSMNKEDYMFHTPSINQTSQQARAMNLPSIVYNTEGVKEVELKELEQAIKLAISKYKIQGIVTGAIQSTYQSSRIQTICNKLGIECFNPLWQADELTYLNNLIKNKFNVILTGVFAFPLNQSWLGKVIDKKFIKEINQFHDKYKISMIGEGGEFETFVLDCPLFKHKLKVISFADFKEGENSFRRELEIN